MAYVIGSVLALIVGLSLTLLKMDRDRSLYPAILLVIAFLYDLFAVMGGSSQALIMETAGGVVFAALAVVGFKTSLWLVVIGLVGHGIYDIFHPNLIDDPGVPAFWPAFCSSYDVVAGLYMAVLVWQNKIREG